MTERRAQPARLREFRRLAQRQHDAERQVEAIIEARNRLLLADVEATDSSTIAQLADACQVEQTTIRKTLDRLRARVQTDIPRAPKPRRATPVRQRREPRP